MDCHSSESYIQEKHQYFFLSSQTFYYYKLFPD